MLEGEIGTEFGVVRVFGRFRDFSNDRPLVLILRGAFPGHTQLFDFPGRLTGADVLIGDLPGMDGAPWVEPVDLAAFARLWDAAMRSGFPGRAHLVVGVSLGAVVAARMESPAALVAVDPAMSPTGMKPLTLALPGLLPKRSPEERRWATVVFAEGADYREALMACRKPGVVLIGEREWKEGRLRSLVSPSDAVMLASHPTLSLHRVERAGHNLPRDAAEELAAAILGQLDNLTAVGRAAHGRPD
jgi:pimeloyl-ACP methyl ester carboxylesterase